MGVIYCHASLEQGLLIAGSFSHDIIKPGAGTDVEDDDIYFTANFPSLTRCHFLALAGCDTAAQDGGGNRILLDAFTSKGVGIVMGFEDIIYWQQMGWFLYYFTVLVHVGDANPGAWHTPGVPGDDPDLSGPQSYDTAASWAAEYAKYLYGSYGGVDTWLIEPGSSMARPAKWGG